MVFPELVVGQRYRVVFERYSDDTGSAPAIRNDRVLEEANCIYERKSGDWWGFIAADGIQRILVNPDSVSYLEIHVEPVPNIEAPDYSPWG